MELSQVAFLGGNKLRMVKFVWGGLFYDLGEFKKWNQLKLIYATTCQTYLFG